MNLTTYFRWLALAGVFAALPAFGATGEDLYGNQCAACHGATGQGDGPRAGQNGIVRPRALSQSVTERMVVEKAMILGVNNTPGHGHAALLAPAELQQLIDYVHNLARR